MSMTPQILREIIARKHQPYVTALVSPSRTFALVTVASEWRMSHWVEHGTIFRMDDAALVADLGDSMWSVDGSEWQSDNKLSLSLSRYPGNPRGVKIDLDLEALVCNFIDEHMTLPLSALCAEMDRLTHRAERAVG